MSEAEIKLKHPGGRPSKYRPEMCDMVFKLCLLGATDERMADILEIDIATFNRWKNDYPEFCEALKAGKEDADAKVAQSLYNRALGYTGKKTVTANINGEITDVRVVDEYVGPDTTAAIFWLKNRQRGKWRDKQEIDHQSSDGSMTPSVAVTIDAATVKDIASKLNDDC